MKSWDEMTARERDVLVAVEIMGEPKPTTNVPPGVLSGFATSSSGGGNWIGTTSGYESGDEPVWMPKPFTSDIAAAWKVVEKMHGSDFNFRCGWVTEGFWAEFRHYEQPTDESPIEGGRAAVDPRDGNMAAAISLAALRAKGVEA